MCVFNPITSGGKVSQNLRGRLGSSGNRNSILTHGRALCDMAYMIATAFLALHDE